MRILIVGASGMLGYTLLHAFSQDESYEVHGTVRNERKLDSIDLQGVCVHPNIDVLSGIEGVKTLIETIKPEIVINCVGIIKQLNESKLPVHAIKINSLLPHQLASFCDDVDARMIHFSTDCVFSGNDGMYCEDSIPDATDLYGRSKLLGEVDYGRHLTLRTSIIGHELLSKNSLIDWFLSQGEQVSGYSKAIFSGLPTIEVARLLSQYVFPNPDLSGLYHLSAEPIDKFSLLTLVASIYDKAVEINEDEKLCIDRSLNSSQFRSATGYKPPPWDDLVEFMFKDYSSFYADR